MGFRRFAVRRSGVHGRGVFALTDLAAGEEIVRFRGEAITWDEACARHERDGGGAHTMFFERHDGSVLDGGRQGNSARWINHGCEPNCEAVEDDDGRIFIVALAPIARGAELFIDYQLVAENATTASRRAQYTCRCGSPACRGTMLAQA